MKKVIAGALLLLIGSLYAGGWDNEVMGVRQLGMGSIFAGIADDATAIFYNPAGILSKNMDVIVDYFPNIPISPMHWGKQSTVRKIHIYHNSFSPTS